MASLQRLVPGEAFRRLIANPWGDTDSTDESNDNDKRWQRRRKIIGLGLLALVIFLWTATNFLASAILADNSFSKPFFLSYLNTSFFIIPLVPALIHRAYRHPQELKQGWQDWKNWMRNPTWNLTRRGGQSGRYNDRPLPDGRSRESRDDGPAREHLLSDSTESTQPAGSKRYTSESEGSSQLSILETARLGAEFCLLWFTASYFLLACLEHTTVASSTILTSTSSVFTLIFGVITGVETFTARKLIGVLLSLAGVVLISLVDFSGQSNDEQHRGSFPEKSTGELVLGNTLALLSAIIYGIYTIFMKKRIPDESKVNMPIFFGFVGLTNCLFLWPGFFILHYTGGETFELPSAGRVTLILLLNATGSMLSDIAWAYAVLLTSPILVTVGLSMNIPLSLIGQAVLNDQTSTAMYWVGAIIVLFSFVIVN